MNSNVATRFALSIVLAAAIVGLLVFAFSALYMPETRNLVAGGEVERNDNRSDTDRAQRVAQCLRDRAWRRAPFVETYGESEIIGESLWNFVDDREASYELFKRRQSSVKFERLRVVRVNFDNLAAAIEVVGSEFEAEIFPDRVYRFSVTHSHLTVIDGQSVLSASGRLSDPYGASGRWSMTLNRALRLVSGTIDAPDSWIRILIGTEDPALAVFGEIDQCEVQQRRRDYTY